ncbi:MAG TPA: right-handed parallel beta-helix repeat-containing protein [Candidatus Dependentiae bacterium]|nr:right-handed parallel beta-helix repeat-containing protein [Candidatus Dependentiae bacterium]HRQ62267.1 right-handed parallel beta-helix repeat-containing protein [Candidatus Dependentiae bacterium]
MKGQPSHICIILLLSIYGCTIYPLIDPQPGENIHNLLFRTAQEIDATYTTVVEIQSTVDINQSLLELISSHVDGVDTDLSIHDVMICSKLEIIESKIDEIMIASGGSQLDVIASKVCTIESLVEVLDFMVSGSLGTVEILSAVEALSVEISVDNTLICSKLDVLDSKLDDIELSDASQLDVLESKIDVIDTDLSIDNMLICSKLQHIEHELEALALSEIDLVNKNMMLLVSISDDLLDTYTVLSSVSEIILDNLSDLDVLILELSSQVDVIDTDLSIDNELVCSKLMVLESKIDDIMQVSDASQLEVLESKIDVLTVDVSLDNELINSKLMVIDSKIDEIGGLDASQLDVLESKIDVLTVDVSLDNKLINSKLMVIDSKIDEIGGLDASQLDVLESKIDVLTVDVSLDNELINSKLVVIDSKIDTIEISNASQLDVLESKIDVLDVELSVHDELVRSQLDVIESIVEDLNIDTELIVSQLDVLESKVDVIDTDLSLDNELICSKLIVIDSKIDEVLATSDVSQLDVLESKIDVLDIELSVHDALVRSQLDIIESIVEDLNIDAELIVSQLEVLESKVEVIDVQISANDVLILDELANIQEQLDDLAECCACDVIIMQSDIPYTIDAPGVYCVGEDIDASVGSIGIDILSTENVVLDLRGHTIDGGSTSGSAIRVSTSNNVVVQNGRVQRKNGPGISMATSTRVTVRNMQINNIVSGGIGISGDDCTIDGCDIASVSLGAGINITAGSNRAVIENCIVRSGATGILSSTTSPNCTIRNCECSNNTSIGFDIRGDNNVIDNCVALGNVGAGVNGVGFDISGANCQVKNSSSVGNRVGIDLNGVTTIELCNNIVNGNTTANFAGGAYDSDLCDDISILDVTVCSKLMVIESKIDNMMSGGDTSLSEVIESRLEVIESKVELLACPYMITQTDIPLTIEAAGTYCLAEDIVGSGTVILINADNVTLDLHGYMLDANSGVGIGLNTTITDIEIINGTIINAAIGIILNNATNVMVSNMQIFDATSYGLTTSGASQLQLIDINTFDVANGFYFDGSVDIQVANCSVMNTTQYGFIFYNTSKTTVYRSAALHIGSSSTHGGFLCLLCTDMVFTDCVAQECGQGFVAETTTNALFEDCIAQRNGDFGFGAGNNASGIQCINCVSSANGSYGFAAGGGGATAVVIRDCIAHDNVTAGFACIVTDLLVIGCQSINQNTAFVDTGSTNAGYWNNSTIGASAIIGIAYLSTGVFSAANVVPSASVLTTYGHYWTNINN